MAFKLRIDPEWNIIQKIKELINADEVLAARGRDYREAALLAAIELVENSLKYSDGEKPQPVEFSFETENGVCEIRVKNTAHNAENREALFRTLKRIQSSNPFDLYVERLEQIRDNPDGFSRMGLIRVAYEGEFSLDCETGDDDTVTIVARRPLDP